jgi:transcriptional regulator with XRE-family HTH domain
VPHGTIVGQAEKRPLTSFQIRAARALVNWSAEDLARHSSVSLRTIRRAELGDRQTSMTAPNDLAIRRVFEVAGVDFVDENGGGPGVRLKKRPQEKR